MMTVTCKIDRVAALKAGIETTSDTIGVNVDLATLSAADRELLASRLNDDMEVCGKCTSDEHAGMFDSGRGYLYKTPHTRYSQDSHVLLVEVNEPTIAGILSAIHEEDAEVAARLADKAQRAAVAAEERRQGTVATLTERRVRTCKTTMYARRFGNGEVEYKQTDYAGWSGVYGLASLTYDIADWPNYSDPGVLGSDEATAWVQELEQRKQNAIETAKREAKEGLVRAEQREREKEDAEKAAEADRAAWIAAHGSDRLKRLLAEDIENESVYLEERLALERPGWSYASDRRGEAGDPRNSKQEGIDLLDEARKAAPDAKLVWWTIEHECDDDCEHYGCEHDKYDWKGYACTAEFLGKDIVFGVPDEYAC